MPHRRRRSCSLVVIALLAIGSFSSSASGDDAPDPQAGTRDLEAGARLWERCAVCHGADGAGRPDGTFPKIAGQHASVIERQIAAIRSGDRSNPVMKPHVEGLADVRDVGDVAAFIAAMPRDPVCQVGPGDDLDLGDRLYRGSCATCHGEAGQGDAAEQVPWMACQHYAYLLRRARQFASFGRSAHPTTEPPLAEWNDAELRAVMDHAARLSAEVTAGGAERTKIGEAR